MGSKSLPNLKRAIPAVVIAIVSYVIGQRLGGITRSTPSDFDLFGIHFTLSPGYSIVLVLVLTLTFVISGVIATRSIARELARVSLDRAGPAAASAIRMICQLIGFAVVGIGLLALLQVDLSALLVGGAVTGVIAGIAAQQTLANFFAGLVLLFARPYVPGQRVRINSGAMGGPFEGEVISAGLTYTTVQTDSGIVHMPNSGLMASAISRSTDPAAPPPPPESDAGTAAPPPAATTPP